MKYYQTKITINEQDKAVADYLKQIGINFSVNYIGDKSNDKDWKHDLWLVSIGKSFTTEYKTGLGHRVKGRVNTKPLRYLYSIDRGAIVTIDRGNTISAVLPTQANILYCLLMDAEASGHSFNDWCDMFGYDSDTFSAFNLYQSCCKIGQELSKEFTHEQINHLRELLEDY